MKIFWREPNNKSVSSLCKANEKGTENITTVSFSPFNSLDKSHFFEGVLESVSIDSFTSETDNADLFLSNGGIKEYTKFLNSAINECKTGNLNKVIASRVVSLKGELNCNQLFVQLLKAYPSCFVYLFEIDDKIYIGATPELLLSRYDRAVKSVALAGTMKQEEGRDVNSWKNKELHEHQLVEDYLKLNFKKYCEYVSVSDKSIVKNGPVCHLHSKVSGTLKSSSLLLDLKNDIHPTPAVCGLPKKKAFDYIMQNEGYNRGYYCGNIGISNTKSESYYVNLRCLSYKNGVTNIYVGGGITSESDAFKELEETKLKSKVLLSIIAKIHKIKSVDE
ncbi:MAG: chorismate-binding protein [Salibacteraceae bacterium]